MFTQNDNADSSALALLRQRLQNLIQERKESLLADLCQKCLVDGKINEEVLNASRNEMLGRLSSQDKQHYHEIYMSLPWLDNASIEDQSEDMQRLIKLTNAYSLAEGNNHKEEIADLLTLILIFSHELGLSEFLKNPKDFLNKNQDTLSVGQQIKLAGIASSAVFFLTDSGSEKGLPQSAELHQQFQVLCKEPRMKMLDAMPAFKEESETDLEEIMSNIYSAMSPTEVEKVKHYFNVLNPSKTDLQQKKEAFVDALLMSNIDNLDLSTSAKKEMKDIIGQLDTSDSASMMYHDCGGGLYIYAGIAEFNKFPTKAAVSIEDPGMADDFDTNWSKKLEEFAWIPFINQLIGLGMSVKSGHVSNLGQNLSVAEKYMQKKQEKVSLHSNKIFPITRPTEIVRFMAPVHQDPTWDEFGRHGSFAHLLTEHGEKLARNQSEVKVFILSSKPPQEMLKENRLFPSPTENTFVCFRENDAWLAVRFIQLNRVFQGTVMDKPWGDLDGKRVHSIDALLNALDSQTENKEISQAMNQLRQAIQQPQALESVTNQRNIKVCLQNLIFILNADLQKNPVQLGNLNPNYVAVHSLFTLKLETTAFSPYETLHTKALLTLAQACHTKQGAMNDLLEEIQAINQSNKEDDDRFSALNQCLINCFIAINADNPNDSLTQALKTILIENAIIEEQSFDDVIEKLQTDFPKPATNTTYLTRFYRAYSNQQRAPSLEKEDVIFFITLTQKNMSGDSQNSAKNALIQDIILALQTDKIDGRKALLTAMEVFATPRLNISQDQDSFHWTRSEESTDSTGNMLELLNNKQINPCVNILCFLLAEYKIMPTEENTLSPDSLLDLIKKIQGQNPPSFDANDAFRLDYPRPDR